MAQFVTLEKFDEAIRNLKKFLIFKLTGLSDFPKTYVGKDLKILRVNGDETAMEFGPRIYISDAAPTSGDGEIGDLWIQTP